MSYNMPILVQQKARKTLYLRAFWSFLPGILTYIKKALQKGYYFFTQNGSKW